MIKNARRFRATWNTGKSSPYFATLSSLKKYVRQVIETDPRITWANLSDDKGRIVETMGEGSRQPIVKTNPIRRVKVSRKKYLSRPSQITGGRPSPRLAARRSKNLREGERGFFPNPDAKKKRRVMIELVGTKSGTCYLALDARIGSKREIRAIAQRLADKFKEPISARKNGYKKNPIEDYSPQEIDAAGRLRESFSGHRSDRAREVSVPVAKVGLEIGPVLAVAYSTTRDGKREKYLHEFRRGARPTLAASSDGRSLFMLGGAFRFTDRGIVDKD